MTLAADQNETPHPAQVCHLDPPGQTKPPDAPPDLIQQSDRLPAGTTCQHARPVGGLPENRLGGAIKPASSGGVRTLRYRDNQLFVAGSFLSDGTQGLA